MIVFLKASLEVYSVWLEKTIYFHMLILYSEFIISNCFSAFFEMFMHTIMSS